MVAIGINQEPLPVTTLPYTQRLLRSLPTTFLKAANSSFFSVTSASITTSLPKSPRRTKRKSLNQDTPGLTSAGILVPGEIRRDSAAPRPSEAGARKGSVTPDVNLDSLGNQMPTEKERQTDYDTRLTHGIWHLATTNAHPAVDLLVCLERRQDIGFRYEDITKPVVIHHGSRDSRVPVDNVKWLGKTMRRCEVRILEGEGHGLMAVAAVMASVLSEVAKEWDDWNILIKGKKGDKRM